MKRPADLSKKELVTIVEALQGHLYRDQAGPEDAHDLPPFAEYWNPGKSWDIALLDRLGELLQEFGLAPDAVAPVVTGSDTGHAELTEADAVEVYAALESKLHLVESGHYDSRYCGDADPAAAQQQWVDHLKALLRKAGPDGRNLV